MSGISTFLILFETLGQAESNGGSKSIYLYHCIVLMTQNAEIGQKVTVFLKIPKSVKNIRYLFFLIVFYA